MTAAASRRAWPAAALALAALAACTTAPLAIPVAPAPGIRPPAPAVSAAALEFEQRTRTNAETQTRRGQLADAATSWELLTVLHPDSAPYRARLDDVRQRIAAALPDHLLRAQQALKRGDLDVATAQYVAVLALDPGQATAADGLRAVERQRNRRDFLGKPSRLTLTRSASDQAQDTAAGRNDLEDAAALQTQGEFDAAVALLERHLGVDRHDAEACRMLADMYFQQGEKQLGTDSAAAAAWYQKSLRLDGANTSATARLAQIGKGLPGGSTRPGGSSRATCNSRP